MVSVTELWNTLEITITNYTGLSPATFFTALAAALTFYYVVSVWFRSPSPSTRREMAEKMEPLPPPVQLGEITAEELSAYDGTDSKKPLLMAIKGQIYDVTQSRMFYGPGGPYALFAGKDASRALAKMSFEKEDLTEDISGLGPFELDALQDWEYKFMGKYVTVGTVKKAVPVTDGSTSETTEASTQTTEGVAIDESRVEDAAESKVREAVPVADGNTSEKTEAFTQTTEGVAIDESPVEDAAESKVREAVPVADGNTSEKTEAFTQTTEGVAIEETRVEDAAESKFGEVRISEKPEEAKAEDLGEVEDSKEHA